MQIIDERPHSRALSCCAYLGFRNGSSLDVLGPRLDHILKSRFELPKMLSVAMWMMTACFSPAVSTFGSRGPSAVA
jgi:hypothetical protein